MNNLKCIRSLWDVKAMEILKYEILIAATPQKVWQVL